MRLDRFLSAYSPYSRREVRILVRKKQISVNGSLAREPDQSVELTDTVTVSGVCIIPKEHVYLMLNKPQGYLSATEDKRDPVVIDLIPEELKYRHFFPVGRLDKDTEGLLFLTDDGQFDHFLMSPRKKVVKRYFAKLDSPAVPEDIVRFRNGMNLGDFTTAEALLEIGENPCEVYVSITEGKFHQVKRMCAEVGKNVLFLKRVAVGGVEMDSALAPGQIRELTEDEMERLGYSSGKEQFS